ncbi:5-AMP-activated protein kinase, regulatory beta subunit [Trypanosoma theileri]|uniref:5-AMP-activated protein kinase, regulatory beta subunit n=1 Tax=Trypanosoma theileri TaxID=67003 RepID=A0A1X0NX44_9TRYP|nr:5-AMP-activated protein kinase, regulatory beta subunit [Trypanosoma theileri]ORC89265.1 5-AMP-activated protein kinase, regulatory beta subunit [Trypanosoma theileri]
MGQPNSRESKFSKRDKSESNAASRKSSLTTPAATTHSVGMRTAGIRENVLQQPSQYRDPLGDAIITQRRIAERKQDGSSSSTTTHTATNTTATTTINTTTNTTAAAGGTTKKYPVVLRYADKNARALLDRKKKIFVAVETLQWQPLQMTPSEDSFYTILELPQGTHRYRFIVDGKNMVDKSQPIADSPGQQQQQNDKHTNDADYDNNTNSELAVNLLELNDALLLTREDEEIMDDGEGWGQEQIIFEESRKYPPLVPVHLRYTPLNTPPNAVRCTRDGVVSAAGEVMPPEHLPLPLNVTINHVYFQRREDHSVMGLTTRYCNKYTTVVYYAKMGTPSG